MTHAEFGFRRARGVVWVCDVRDSSKLLNNDKMALTLEHFLPRLHWLGITAANSAGGVFVKWTGDGFLAWFETPLHRDVTRTVAEALEAIWHLSFTVNVTQLKSESSSRITVRHGLTYEHDALITELTHKDGHRSIDVIGRAVVLAFRLSSISAHFPGVVMDATVAKAAKEGYWPHISVKSWNPNASDVLRYFKGEKWGTRGLAVSTEKKGKRSLRSIVKTSTRIIAKVDQKAPMEMTPFSVRYTEAFQNGPEWARAVQHDEAAFIRVSLLQPLKALTDQAAAALKERAT